MQAGKLEVSVRKLKDFFHRFQLFVKIRTLTLMALS